MIRSRVPAFVFAVSVLPPLAHLLPAQSTRQHDWSLGQPRVWYYDRVYPFLDGIFQDVASTQLQPLLLSPNAANASQLDAIQSSYGLGLAFSPATAAQNALAQQANAVTVANSQLQTELLAQQAQLTQQVLVATQQAGQATAAYDQLNGSPNPDPNQLAAAKTAVTLAQDQLNSATAQLNAVKTQLPATIAATPTSYTPVTASQPSSVNLPTSLSQLTAPPNAPPSPNFPSSKQMDNQLNLLWERLSRLVSTIAQADSLKDDDILLAGFDVNLLPSNEKNRVFGAQYQLSGCSNSAVIVDLFPSASAVNITSTQYKDSRGAIGAVASWFGFGLNAAYNREHLQISQQLGQSAYITGFGVGTNTFGWVFGRNLGDKEVSPGKRTVFAIIAAPTGCKDLHIQSQRAGWVKNNFKNWYAPISSGDVYADPSSSISIDPTKIDSDPVVTRVRYTPVEFDPTSSTTTVASLRIDLQQAMDPQMTISVDGHLLPRARDTFARAIPNGGGSGGFLEATAYNANTWIPTSATALVISFDASKVERRFPEIVLSTTHGTTNLTTVLPKLDEIIPVPRTPTPRCAAAPDGTPPGVPSPCATLEVRGDLFECFSPCIANMPPLSYRKAPMQTLSVFHLDGVMPNPEKGQQKVDAQVIFSLGSDAPPTPNSGSTTSNVQVLTTGPSPWGGNALVLMEFQHGNQARLLRLPCQAIDGMRLNCRVPVKFQEDLDTAVAFEVHDPDHSGAAITAQAVTAARAPKYFRVWSNQQPGWRQGKDAQGNSATLLSFCITFANADDKDSFALGSANGAPLADPEYQFQHNSRYCPVFSNKPDSGFWSGELAVPLAKFPALTDQMTLVRVNQPDPPATLRYLRSSAQPVVLSTPSSDFKHFYGQGLVFPKMQIGSATTSFDLQCDPAGTSCSVKDPNADLGKASGPIYLLTADGVPIPLMQNTNGVLAALAFVPPAATGSDANQAGGKGQGQMTLALNLSASGSGGSSGQTGGGASGQPGGAAPGQSGAGVGANPNPAPPAPPPAPVTHAPAGTSTVIAQ